MATVGQTPSVREVGRVDTATLVPSWRPPSVAALIVGSWLGLLAADASGVATALHHHALIESATPLTVAIPAFLAGWLVMVAAMMLPASLPTIQVLEVAIATRPDRRWAGAAFLAAFAIVWVAFGLAAFLGDVGLHHLVDATPWLAGRPWLIEAGILAIAGGYQFAPVKRRALAACRHPAEAIGSTRGQAVWSTARLGFDHGLACLGSSWALMLLMFGEGFANLGWMVALAGLMTYEATGRHGPHLASVAGVGLLLAALAVL